jgi:uncharacterized protein (DUF1697 family)
MQHIALLRGINMGGHKKVAMSDLLSLAAGLGLENARTLLQSGNLVFTSSKAPAALEALLERALMDRLGLATHVLVRTDAEWAKIVAANPYPAEAGKTPSLLAVLFLKHKPAAKKLAELKTCIVGREYFEAHGCQLYAFYPDGSGTSKFTVPLIDRKLETVATGRNWNTVLKLAKAVGG